MAALSAGTLVELDQSGFLWRLWDGDAVAYDSLSGDTHRFYSPAGHLISVLQDSSGPVRWGELIAASESGSGVESAAETLISTGLLRYSAIETP